MKCLVTGGAGFIGSHIVERLLRDGNTVSVVDNFSTGRRENLAQHRENRNLSVIEADLSQTEGIKEYFKGIDTVFHIAALADIVPSIVNPAAYYRSNVEGTFSLMEAARAGKVKRIIYAASSSCYGVPDLYPTPESAALRPQYPYALTKLLGEEIVLHWGRVYKIPVVSLRLFNVYGPRSRTSGTYGAVFGVFLAQKINGKPYTIVGDGRQTRDFIFVSDVVEAFIAAADSGLKDEIMNVGSGGTYSVNRLVELMGGESLRIPKRPGEPDCTFADIAKIKKLLGWRPKVNFEQGVKIMLENIDYWRKAPLWTPEGIENATKEWFEYLSK